MVKAKSARRRPGITPVYIRDEHFYTMLTMMNLRQLGGQIKHVKDIDQAGRTLVFGRVMPSRLH